MSGPFGTIGSLLDRALLWLFGEVQGAVHGAMSSTEAKRVLGSGIAFALAGAAPHLAKAAAASSKNELLAALSQGFVTGAAGSAASALHRLCDGDPNAPAVPPADTGAVPLAETPKP